MKLRPVVKNKNSICDFFNSPLFLIIIGIAFIIFCAILLIHTKSDNFSWESSYSGRFLGPAMWSMIGLIFGAILIIIGLILLKRKYNITK